ncbi:hypothetical protein [Bacteroides sp. UBA939]|uniref:hypothetical protein n=1 Tax=Bacteroides sp. UBA939 TaxID=1946092 RepID=UPI0025BCE23E|nr:hypothetical protein [Bacteroides sp. UBA939]
MTKQKNNSKFLRNDYIGKCTDPSRLIQSVRKLFSSGGKFTAKELNSLAGTNDARKIISVLRNKEGWKIEDCQLSDGRKLYWLAGKGGEE